MREMISYQATPVSLSDSDGNFVGEAGDESWYDWNSWIFLGHELLLGTHQGSRHRSLHLTFTIVRGHWNWDALGEPDWGVAGAVSAIALA